MKLLDVLVPFPSVGSGGMVWGCGHADTIDRNALRTNATRLNPPEQKKRWSHIGPGFGPFRLSGSTSLSEGM